MMIGVPLAKQLLQAGGGLTLDISPLHEKVFDTMERARIDVLLHADDGRVPAHFCREICFEEEFICVVSKESRVGARFTERQYLAAAHVGVSIFGDVQTVPEQQLSAVGSQRRCPVTVAHFSVAMQAVIGTSLVATIPKRFALAKPRDVRLAFVKPPKFMKKYNYLMVWHPRMDKDAAHIWLRQSIRSIAASLRT